MSINFPNSPAVNDIFTAGVIKYKWDGTKWYSITEGYLPLTGGTLTGALTVNDQTTAAQFNGPLNGNANTATALQTSRTINGTSFDGSANITTNSWGTSRTVTIGSTGKSVDGSANVTWSLSEIGAQAADADLTAIAALSGTSGLLKKTAADTWTLDTNTYLTSYSETDPVYTASSWYTTTNNSTNWDAAYSWGNHAGAGYLNGGAIGVTVQGYSSNLTNWAALATSAKQDALVSGTNIKTINGSSLLGSGDLTLFGGGLVKVEVVATLPGTPDANTLYIVTT